MWKRGWPASHVVIVGVLVSSRGESHPPALAEPYVTVARHTAPTGRPRVGGRRCQWAKSRGWCCPTAASQARALAAFPRRRLNFCLAHRAQCAPICLATEYSSEPYEAPE